MLLNNHRKVPTASLTTWVNYALGYVPFKTIEFRHLEFESVGPNGGNRGLGEGQSLAVNHEVPHHDIGRRRRSHCGAPTNDSQKLPREKKKRV